MNAEIRLGENNDSAKVRPEFRAHIVKGSARHRNKKSIFHASTSTAGGVE